MHAFILTMLLVAGADFTVLPFNVSLACCAVAVLLDDAEPQSRIRLRPLAKTFGGALAVAYGVVFPILSLIGFVDMRLSHDYYAGGDARMRWYVKPHFAELFPADAKRFRLRPVPEGARPAPEGMVEAPIHHWVDRELGQGLIGEARIAETVKDALCRFGARSPDDVILRFYAPAEWATGNRVYREVNCDQTLGFWMRLGGLKTVVIGGDGPLYELEPSGDPTF
jgi:hypothetical protein